MKAVSSGPGPITALLLAVCAFVVVYANVQLFRVEILSRFTTHGVREVVALRALTSLLLDWAMFAAIVIILRLRGQRLRDIGWARRSPLMGWLTAAVVAVLYAGFTVMGPALRHAPLLSDWSLFRVGTALAIGVSAGICEEAVFRGFVMTQAREAGSATWLQVLLSAILFGLAHVGWGGLTGHFQLGPMIGAVMATVVLGALLALVYHASRRSLMPVVAAHGAIDMVIEPWLLLFVATGGH
jgi:membrane protease YdiL (CAAX protease family)